MTQTINLTNLNFYLSLIKLVKSGFEIKITDNKIYGKRMKNKR